MVCRMDKLKDLFDLVLQVQLHAYPQKSLFFNNALQITGLIENLLLILTSSASIKNCEISIEIYPCTDRFIIEITSKNCGVNFITDALENILRRQNEDFSEDAGFNNFHYNILLHCLKGTSSCIQAVIEKNLPIIRITIPSQFQSI